MPLVDPFAKDRTAGKVDTRELAGDTTDFREIRSMVVSASGVRLGTRLIIVCMRMLYARANCEVKLKQVSLVPRISSLCGNPVVFL